MAKLAETAPPYQGLLVVGHLHRRSAAKRLTLGKMGEGGSGSGGPYIREWGANALSEEVSIRASASTKVL